MVVTVDGVALADVVVDDNDDDNDDVAILSVVVAVGLANGSLDGIVGEGDNESVDICCWSPVSPS